jgi:hypothetical protein
VRIYEDLLNMSRSDSNGKGSVQSHSDVNYDPLEKSPENCMSYNSNMILLHLCDGL